MFGDNTIVQVDSGLNSLIGCLCTQMHSGDPEDGFIQPDKSTLHEGYVISIKWQYCVKPVCSRSNHFYIALKLLIIPIER